MKRTWIAPWVWLTPFVLAGCAAPADDDTDETDVDDGPPVDLAGSWRAVSGDGAPLGSWATNEVRYATFEPGASGDSGRMLLYGEDAVSGLLACPTGLFAFNGDGGLVVSGRAAFGGSRILLVTVVDADTIELVDETGLPQRFERVDEVPTDAQCGAITVNSDVVVDIGLANSANLLWNGTEILVGDDLGAFYEVDPADGSLGDSHDYGTAFDNLVTMQGADGWGHCGCGGSEDIARMAEGGTQVDLVETNALGSEIGVDAAAWDGTNLLVVGYSYDDRRNHLLVVDTEAEPDTLGADVILKAVPSQITLHDGAVIGFDGNLVFELDTATGTASATWQIPAAWGDLWWRGITSSGPDLFLLGVLDSEVHLLQIDLD